MVQFLVVFVLVFVLVFIIINLLCVGHDLKRIADALEDFVYDDEDDAEESEVAK